MKQFVKRFSLILIISIFLVGCVQAKENIDLYSSVQHTADSPEWVKQLPQAQDRSVKQLFVVAGMNE